MQHHELEAWLGEDHCLDTEQFEQLLGIAEQISERYPDPDDAEERDAALGAAYLILISEDKGVIIDELAVALSRSRQQTVRATAGLRQAALMLVPGSESESSYARRVGVDRMTVRSWLGK